MPSISERQNQQQQINRLKAQRTLYDEVRKIKMIRLFGTVVLNAFWVYYATITWHSELIVVAGSGSIMLLEYLTEVFWQEKRHKKAVLVQELFDTEVLQLPWNEDHSLIGCRPLADEVDRWAGRYNEERYKNAPLQDWYSKKVDAIPLPYARLCCQKSNIDWDVQLRKHYIAGYLALVVGVVVLMGLAIYLWGLDEIQKLWLFIAAALPVARMGWEESKNNLKAIENLKNIREKINRKWNEVLNGEASEEEVTASARVWQDEIFRHRLLSPVLPRFLYKRKRSEDEAAMNSSSGALAEEMQAFLKTKARG